MINERICPRIYDLRRTKSLCPWEASQHEVVLSKLVGRLEWEYETIQRQSRQSGIRGNMASDRKPPLQVIGVLFLLVVQYMANVEWRSSCWAKSNCPTSSYEA